MVLDSGVSGADVQSALERGLPVVGVAALPGLLPLMPAVVTMAGGGVLTTCSVAGRFLELPSSSVDALRLRLFVGASRSIGTVRSILSLLKSRSSRCDVGIRRVGKKWKTGQSEVSKQRVIEWEVVIGSAGKTRPHFAASIVSAASRRRGPAHVGPRRCS